MTTRQTRRQVLGTVGVTLGLSGCLSNSTSTDPVQGGDELSFETIYSSTFEQHRDVLESKKIEQISPEASVIKKIEQANYLAHQSLEFQAVPPSARALRAIVHNQLDYSVDRVRIFLRKDGAGNQYKVIFVKEPSGDWIKHLGYVGASKDGSVLEHGTKPGENSSISRRLYDLWNQDQVAAGAATAIHTYRNGVKQARSWEKFTETEWQEAAKPLDRYNDSVVVGETEAIGEIGYSRAAAETLVEIQDFDEVSAFNTEMQFVEELTLFYFNEVKDGEYIHIGVTEDKLKDGQHELVSVDDSVLVASVVSEEKHVQDAFTVHIPESIYQEEIVDE